MTRKKYDASRRGFLRSAVASAMLGPTLIGMGQATPESVEAAPTGPDAMVLGRIKLDQEVANQAGVLSGHLRFLRAVSGPVIIRWIDSFGRVSGEQTLSVGAGTVIVPFSFNMRAGLTYVNWIRVTVNGVPQVATAKFMLSPEHTPWNDFHTISWAHYPDGFYDQLRAAGMDAIIAYVNDDFDPVLDNDFKFYVEQMAWEVFLDLPQEPAGVADLADQGEHEPAGSGPVGSRSLCQRSEDDRNICASTLPASPAFTARIVRCFTTLRMSLDKAIKFVRTIFAIRNSAPTSSPTTCAKCTGCLLMLAGNGEWESRRIGTTPSWMHGRHG